MQISRRNALMGATAVAVVTGTATVPFAVKAAGDPDADLLALCDQLDATLVASEEVHRRLSTAQDEAHRTMPLEKPWLAADDPVECARKEAVLTKHMEDAHAGTGSVNLYDSGYFRLLSARGIPIEVGD